MCLLSVGLETLALLLRIWLWISVPMAVIILLVATYFNYLRQARHKGVLALAIEGWGGEAVPEEPYIGRDDVVGDGRALRGEESEETRASELRGEDGLTGQDDLARGNGVGSERGVVGENGIVSESRLVDEIGLVDEGELGLAGVVEDEDGFAEGLAGVVEGEDAELGATGKETIYRGILWMKEKYEQYREQTDRRYEQLRDELGKSERRYQELLAVMEQNRAEGNTMSNTEVMAKQGIIDELEAQLRSERMKVEELVVKLQENSELLLKIYQELEKAPDLGKEAGKVPS